MYDFSYRQEKRPRILLTWHLGSDLAWGEGAERGALTGSPGGKDECPDRSGKHRTNHPTQGRFHGHGEGGKVARRVSRGKKMLKYDERSRNVYENKEKDDNFTEGKGDIFARMTMFDTKRRVSDAYLTGTLGLLTWLERWGTNPALQNAETRRFCNAETANENKNGGSQKRRSEKLRFEDVAGS